MNMLMLFTQFTFNNLFSCFHLPIWIDRCNGAIPSKLVMPKSAPFWTKTSAILEPLAWWKTNWFIYYFNFLKERQFKKILHIKSDSINGVYPFSGAIAFKFAPRSISILAVCSSPLECISNYIYKSKCDKNKFLENSLNNEFLICLSFMKLPCKIET